MKKFHKLKLTTLLLSSVLAFASCSSFAADTNDAEAVKIMQAVEKHASPPDEEVKISMKLIDSNNSTSSRTATFYRKQRAENSLDDSKLIRFHTPAEMQNSAVLTLENASRSDDQWLYLPAYHTSRKIPSSNRGDRYMGTDFFYEDVSDDKIAEYNYKITGKEVINSRNCTVIEQVPTNDTVKKESAYGKKIKWVDAERNLVAKIEYYDKSGKLSKRYTAENAVQTNGFWRWQKVTMIDVQLNHKTTIDYSDRKINSGVDKNLFTVRSLERS
jgi:outer membrane lipoprotein-sorting protein